MLRSPSLQTACSLFIFSAVSHGGLTVTNPAETLVRASNGSGNLLFNEQVVSTTLDPFDHFVSVTSGAPIGLSDGKLTLNADVGITGAVVSGEVWGRSTFTEDASPLFFSSFNLRIVIDEPGYFTFSANTSIGSTGIGRSYVQFYQWTPSGNTYPDAVDVLFGSGQGGYGATGYAVNTSSYNASAGGTASGYLVPGRYEIIGQSIVWGDPGEVAATYSLQVSIPEPASTLLLVLGAASFGFRRLRSGRPV